MPDHTVTPLRPRAPSGYTDTLALNDIHALLTTQGPGDATLTGIALILARSGRPMTAARDIEITTTETALGWPVACAQSGDASVFIRQAPSGPGLLVEIYTKSAAEHDGLTVTLDGATLHPASQPDRPYRPGHRPRPPLNERNDSMSSVTPAIPDNPAAEPPPWDSGPGAPTAGNLPASSAQPEPGSVAVRPVIAVALLTAHPGNVRRDLDLSPDFLASIQANGVLVPLRITPRARRRVPGDRRPPPAGRRHPGRPGRGARRPGR